MAKAKYLIKSVHPHVLPSLEDWPVYKLSEDRKNFVEDLIRETVADLLDQPVGKVTDLISQTMYRERIRIKEEPWKVDPPKEKQFWSRIRKSLVKYSLDQPEEIARKNNQELLERIVRRYAEEIVGTFRIPTFLFARRFLTFFFNRLLQAKQRGFFRLGGARKRLYEKITVHGDVPHVQELFRRGTVVVVPTHHSNLDSIMIGYALDAIVGLPSFSYGAGLNLYNTGYTAYFMNRIGAYRIDRRKKNAIYLRTLKLMSKLSIERGVNNLFFPGGTRSRSGALETRLKLGMLNTTVQAQRSLLEKGEDTKIFVVPLILSYHFVLEAPQLIEQHLRRSGKERYIKSKDNSYKPLKILKFIWQVLAEGNDIQLSIGQPLDVLGNPVDREGNSYDQFGKRIDIRDYFMRDGRITHDKQRESEYTKNLGEAVVERYHRDNLVLSSHLVAFAAFNLLKQENKKLDLFGILRLPTEDYVFDKTLLSGIIGQLLLELRERKAQQQIKLSAILSTGEVPEIIEDGLKHLGTFHVKKPLRYNRKKEIISENFRLLYFYHNRLENYDLDDKIRIVPGKLGLPEMEVS